MDWRYSWANLETLGFTHPTSSGVWLDDAASSPSSMVWLHAVVSSPWPWKNRRNVGKTVVKQNPKNWCFCRCVLLFLVGVFSASSLCFYGMHVWPFCTCGKTIYGGITEEKPDIYQLSNMWKEICHSGKKSVHNTKPSLTQPYYIHSLQIQKVKTSKLTTNEMNHVFSLQPLLAKNFPQFCYQEGDR